MNKRFIYFRDIDVFMQPDIAVTIEVRPREEALISRDKLVQVLRSGDSSLINSFRGALP
jgi:exopolysaccharide biosynthesis predicted pyruvyltransferase EpsI